MARLTGALQMTGKLGNLSMFKDKNGNVVVRTKGGPTKQQVKKTRAFSNFRRAGTEFGRASKAGGYIRNGFGSYGRPCADHEMNGRLNKALLEIIQTDKKHEWGQRILSEGDIELLEGFEWNQQLSVEEALSAEIAGFIEPESGVMHAIVSRFKPSTAVKRPEGATHFQLYISGSALHAEKGTKVYKMLKGEMLAFDRPTVVKGATLSLELDPKEATILLLGAGLLYYQEVNGHYHMMKGGAFGIIRAAKTVSGKQ